MKLEWESNMSWTPSEITLDEIKICPKKVKKQTTTKDVGERKQERLKGSGHVNHEG